MVFLLLIFFLVATKFADIERDVRIRPPSTRHAKPVTAIPDELVVNVEKDGTILVGGQERSRDDLSRLLGMAAARNEQQAVVIRGDQAAVLQYAVDVLDLCEKHGISRTYLTTSPAVP